jgi:programmed cell death protein 5
MVRPDFAEKLELSIIRLAQAGKIKLPMTDQQLREILERLQSQRREIKIQRV